ncbi:helix-turn-helix domain-containing protein [Bacillus salitolerans]|uniref:Helix-turn-helix domain-containing protein n=1 Tax=Bacillus salitolerans TaxID=1437434 RepID=A0ABW4LLQ1_9BACI
MEERFKLSDIYTASTASTKRGIPYSTLKDDLVRYGKFDEHIKKGFVKKEGRVWILTKQALDDVYGKEKGVE